VSAQVKDMRVKCHRCKDTGVVSIPLPTHPHLFREWPCPDCRRVVTAELLAAADELAEAADASKPIKSQSDLKAWGERLWAARLAYLSRKSS